jgi:hypothetical protein
MLKRISGRENIKKDFDWELGADLLKVGKGDVAGGIG